jgi:OOP family OmpA-OmpF porin
MVVAIDGREAGVIETPPAGYSARLPIRWPPTFSLRLEQPLPSVGAGEGPSAEPIAGTFRVRPLQSSSAAQDVTTDAEGVLRIDWLLPGEQFDLFYRPPQSGNEVWLWYAGPFEIEANAEETLQVSPGGTIRLQGVQFETGSDSFDPRTAADTARVLNLLASQLKRYLAIHPRIRIDVEGHTDAVGTEESNALLSQRRAETVRAHLVGRGVDPLRISATGYGESSPLASNEGAEGRAVNRRVEIHFRSD